jgi:glycosyltransferase involved in cell wall biosynthesis
MRPSGHRLRVSVLSKALVVGAYQRKCELIAAHDDIDLTVLLPPAWAGQRLERVHTRGYALRVIPIRLDGHFHLHHYPTLGQELRRAAPQILHVDEEPYNLATWLAVRQASRLRPRPHVLFFSWQNILRRYPPPFRYMERDVLNRADAAIVGSTEARAVWQAKGFRKPIYVIPQFGVDEDHFRPLPNADKMAASFVVGYAGRLVPEKGVDVLLKAFSRLPSSARLVIAGSGPAEAALRHLARCLGIAERVTFCAPIPSTQMPAFYRSLDVFVLPSRAQPNWKEQFGRVLVEAMACGVPVVASRCGEAPNVVGDAGVIFDEEDISALAARLSQLMSQPGRRAELAQRGRARVIERYTMRRIADQTVEVYRELAGDQDSLARRSASVSSSRLAKT